MEESRIEVSEMVGKPHDQLMRSIRTYIDYMDSAKMQSADFFIEHLGDDHKSVGNYFIEISKPNLEKDI